MSVAQFTRELPSPTCLECPLLPRLEKAKACYRAQQAEIQRLHDLLMRYQLIGVRRFYDKEARQFLVGTETLYENTILRRAVEQRDRALQHQACVIAALKAILPTVETQPEGQEVAS